jgi:hypothetical protein
MHATATAPLAKQPMQSRFATAKIELAARALPPEGCDIVEILAWDQSTGGIVAIATDDAGNHSFATLNQSDLTAKFTNGYFFPVEHALEAQAYRIVTPNRDLEI